MPNWLCLCGWTRFESRDSNQFFLQRSGSVRRTFFACQHRVYRLHIRSRNLFVRATRDNRRSSNETAPFFTAVSGTRVGLQLQRQIEEFGLCGWSGMSALLSGLEVSANQGTDKGDRFLRMS